MKASFRRGLRVFSTAFIIYLLAFVLSMVLGFYSLIIILPVIFPLFDIFSPNKLRRIRALKGREYRVLIQA